MRLPTIALSAAILMLSGAAHATTATPVFYSATYHDAKTTLVVSDQETPIPVPVVGTPIEVMTPQGHLQGTVGKVTFSTLIKKDGQVEVREFQIDVAVR